MKPRINKMYFAVDIVNMFLCVIILLLSVFTFLDVTERTIFFPYIILLGSIVNALFGYKEVRQKDKKSRVFFAAASILFIVSLLIFAGFGGF